MRLGYRARMIGRRRIASWRNSSPRKPRVARNELSYPDQVRRAERKAIAQRYRKRGRTPAPMAALRVAELTRLLVARYGEFLPDDDAGRDDAALVCHHLARRSGGKAPQRIASWLEQRTPWMAADERAALADKVLANPLRWKADTLAARLRLTAAERARHSIRTIGAIDESAADRAEARRIKKQMGKQEARRTAGAIPRGEFEAASTQRQQPWQALGISRRTWYRRRGTGPAPI